MVGHTHTHTHTHTLVCHIMYISYNLKFHSNQYKGFITTPLLKLDYTYFHYVGSSEFYVTPTHH